MENTNHDFTEQYAEYKVFARSLEFKWRNSAGTTGTIIAGIAIVGISHPNYRASFLQANRVAKNDLISWIFHC